MDKRKGVLNIGVSVGFKLVLTVVVIIVKRYLIQFCGNEVNGLNSLYLSIIGFLAVAELGIGNAITFCMYKPIVEGKQETVAALYHLFNKIYTLVGFLILVTGLLLTPFIPLMAKDYEQLDVNLYTTFLLMLVSVVVTYSYGAKTALIVAHKNTYITTAISSVGALLQYALQIIVLFVTSSFEWYLICRIISAISQGIATEIITRRKYHDILLTKIKKIDTATRKELFKSTKAMFMHKIGTLLVNTVDSLVISIFVGVISLGLYSNYSAISSAMHSVLTLFFSSMTSIIGHLYVSETKEVTRRYCELFHLINYLLGIVFYLGYYAVIDNLISILFSPDLVVARSVPFVIALNGFIHFMKSSVLVFRDATGAFYNDRWKPLVEGIANIVLSVLFVNMIGVVGVIVATAITNLLICHVVEPYVLYKNAFFSSPKNYYICNYSMIACFCLALILLDYCMQSLENAFAELFVNGLVSLCISIPICVLVALLQWKKYGYLFKSLISRRNV